VIVFRYVKLETKKILFDTGLKLPKDSVTFIYNEVNGCIVHVHVM